MRLGSIRGGGVMGAGTVPLPESSHGQLARCNHCIEVLEEGVAVLPTPIMDSQPQLSRPHRSRDMISLNQTPWTPYRLLG